MTILSLKLKIVITNYLNKTKFINIINMIKSQTNMYDSSTIEASTYNFSTKELFVSFKHATYLYRNVEANDYLTFANEKSQGIALNSIIKGKYEFEKLEVAE